MIYWLRYLFPAHIISYFSVVCWVLSSTSCELKGKIPTLMHQKFLNTNNYITKTEQKVPPSCVSPVVLTNYEGRLTVVQSN